MHDNYFIKDKYVHSQKPHFYHDSLEDSQTYQLDIYKHAAQLIIKHNIESVLDIGCGMGTKLKDFIFPHTSNITGVDSDHSIPICKKIHNFGNWIIADLEDKELCLDQTFDLIISADVIEHLIDPDNLLRLLAKCSHKNTIVVLSTPERDLRRGVDDLGPPKNHAHVREWNEIEFRQYIQSRGFQIDGTRIVDLCNGMATCQMVTGSIQRFKEPK